MRGAGSCAWGLGAGLSAVRCVDARPGQLAAAGDDGNVMVGNFDFALLCARPPATVTRRRTPSPRVLARTRRRRRRVTHNISHYVPPSVVGSRKSCASTSSPATTITSAVLDVEVDERLAHEPRHLAQLVLVHLAQDLRGTTLSRNCHGLSCDA